MERLHRLNKITQELLRKTLTSLLVGVFLFVNTLSWAQEERLFSTGTENMSFSSGSAIDIKLSPLSKFDYEGLLKHSLTAAAICKYIEFNGNIDETSYLDDVLNRLDAYRKHNITVSPYEIIIEIPEERLAIRYFDPTKANVITPYTDISKFTTKAISPRLKRQIIHRTKALPRPAISEQSVALAREAFANPQKYRDLMLRQVKIEPLERYDGKGLICLFLTRFCPVGCRRCFYVSPHCNGKKTQEDTFTEEGVAKLIKFIRDANIGYLLVAGGGDPFVELKSVYRLTEEAKSDTIVLVTSGFWAKKRSCALKIVNRLHEAFKKRKTKAKVILRISIDKDHVEKIGLQPIINLIEIFQEKFANEENFELQIHTMFDDPTVYNLLQQLPVATTSVTKAKPVEDMIVGTEYDEAIKISGQRMEVGLENGFSFIIGFAKFFYTDWKVNLYDKAVLERNIDIFDRDMQESEFNNPAITYNTSAKKGLDFFIPNDGSVLSWGCNSPDNALSLYRHDHRTIVERILADIISLSFIEKGMPYRDAILNEVNPKAVIRTKAINMRDFAGSIVNEETKTRLYLSIRILQDYIQEGRIALASLPTEIQQLVSLDRQTLIELYHESDYSIVNQYLDRPGVSVNELVDLYELLLLGHYDVTPERMREAIESTSALNRNQKDEFFAKIAFQEDKNIRQFYEWAKEKNYALCAAYLKSYISIYNNELERIKRVFGKRYLPYLLTYLPPILVMNLRDYLYNTPDLNVIALIISTDEQYGLEKELTSREAHKRESALKRLNEMIQDEYIVCAPQTEEGNIHVHSKFSFSPHYPEAIAYWAKRGGLREIGIMDHDTSAGIESFREAAEKVRQKAVSGVEMRVNMTGTSAAHRIFNASDVENVVYLLCHGMPCPNNLQMEIAKLLQGSREAKETRNREMIRRINRVLEKLGTGIIINYDKDVLPLAENGNCVDRHLTLALALKVSERKDCERIYAKIFGKEELSKAEKEAVKTPEGAMRLLRYALLKPGTKHSCFIHPNKTECPGIKYTVSIIKKAGGIPVYPYPEPSEANIVEEEKALRRLFPVLKDIGVLGVEIMTNRLKEEEIRLVKNLAHEFGLMVFGYRDVNKDTTPFIDEKAPITKYPEFKIGADFLVGHEFLARYTGFGYYSPEFANILPDDDERFRFFASVGALSFKKLQLLRKELEDLALNPQDIWAKVDQLIRDGRSVPRKVSKRSSSISYSIKPWTRRFVEYNADRLLELYNLIPLAAWKKEQLTKNRWKKGEFDIVGKDRIFWAKGKHSLIVVDENERPMGLLIAYERAGGETNGVNTVSLYIHGLAMDPYYRGRGIGTELMMKLAQNLKQRGFLSRWNYRGPPYISLQTGTTNKEAIRFYERLGFKRVGIKEYPDHTDYVYLAKADDIIASAVAAESDISESGVKTKDAYGKFVQVTSPIISTLLADKKEDILLRIPIEAIEYINKENIRDISNFLETFQEANNRYVELYYTSGIGEASGEMYQKFGLQKKSLPQGFKRTRENTVTLFPAFKGEELDQSAIRSRLGSFDLKPEDTILSPIGIQHDSAGLIRGTVLGLIMMQIAQDISRSPDLLKQPDKYAQLKDRVQREVLEQSKNIWDSNAEFKFTSEDIENIIGLITGDINSIVPALNKLIKLLPITPIDVDELRQIFEYAAKKFA